MGDVLHNREYAQQLKIFAGLKWGRISPTDIDAFLDFGDKLFVFVEVKHGASMPPIGQRIALERLCDACQNEARVSAVLIAAHSTSEDIHVKDLPVIRYRYLRQWRKPTSSITVHEAISKFRDIAGINRES